MSVAELKHTVDQCSREERLFLAAYLQHKMHAPELSEAADLETRMSQMDAGDKIPFSNILKLHEELIKAGV